MPPQVDLRDRIGIITGASAGIGRAMARELSSHGARLIVNARRGDRLDSLVRELGSDRTIAVPGDCAEQTVIDAMFAAAEEQWGHARTARACVDLVVVNAGRGLRGAVTDSNVDEWEEMVRTNYVGAALLMRIAAAHMRAGAPAADPPAGRLDHPRDIVVIGSNVGKNISPFSSMYGSTKFAVGSLAEALRRELGPAGIRVSLVCPGIVRTEFQDAAGYDPVAFGRFMDSVGPVLVPEDVARLIAFMVAQPPNVHINDVVIRPTRQDYP